MSVPKGDEYPDRSHPFVAMGPDRRHPVKAGAHYALPLRG
jgi:hypothetical protein